MNQARDDTRMPSWLENAWLQRYLERQLSEEEVIWFETYQLDKADLVQALEADNDLRDALASLPPAAAAPVASTRWRRSPQWAAAAALVLACGMGGLGGYWLSRSSTPALFGNPTRLVFDTLRDAESPPRIDHADSKADWVLVEVEVPVDAEALTLRMAGADALALSRSPEGFVSFAASRASLLAARNAVLSYHHVGIDVDRQISFTALNPRKQP